MQDKKYYSFIFISIIALICAGLLSFAVMFLRPRQELNEMVEKKKNILIAMGIAEGSVTQQEIIQKFDQYIESFVINYKGESVDLPEGQTVADIDPETEENKAEADQLLPLYQQKENDMVVAYCLPVFGKGLWSTIYGYLALERDLNTIKGITFYKQGETPGLGAEAAAKWFTDNFKGKKIFDEKGKLVSATVVKGKAESTSPNFIHEVDGISGATKTCDGINAFLLKDLNKYKAFLLKNR